jgi:hypothetical protein
MEKLKAHPFFSEHSFDTRWGNLLNERSPLEANVKLSSRPKLSDDEVNIQIRLSKFIEIKKPTTKIS